MSGLDGFRPLNTVGLHNYDDYDVANWAVDADLSSLNSGQEAV